nr:MAG TPA: hypothetical protein [Inoviridae sp.]
MFARNVAMKLQNGLGNAHLAENGIPLMKKFVKLLNRV